jgi:hypothetical protein
MEPRALKIRVGFIEVEEESNKFPDKFRISSNGNRLMSKGTVSNWLDERSKDLSFTQA